METCIFCEILEGKKSGYFVYQDEVCSALLDVNPLAVGHILIIPNRHFQHLNEATDQEMKHLLMTTNRVLSALKKTNLPCKGANILINDGKAANQHIPHLHVHVIPRKGKDLGKIILNILFRRLAFARSKSKHDRFKQISEEIRAQMVQMEMN